LAKWHFLEEVTPTYHSNKVELDLNHYDTITPTDILLFTISKLN